MKMIELFKGKGLFKKILYSDQLFAVPHFLSESINHCRKAFETAVNLLKIFWNNLPDSYIIYCEFLSTAEKCPHHVGIYIFFPLKHLNFYHQWKIESLRLPIYLHCDCIAFETSFPAVTLNPLSGFQEIQLSANPATASALWFSIVI